MSEYSANGGMNAGTAVGIGVAALFGVGLLWAANRGGYGYGYHGCGCHSPVDPYLLGENNGQVKAGIACNANAIARVENALSQMQQTAAIGSIVHNGSCQTINAINSAQNDTNAGLASISTNVGRLSDTVNRALGNCFVWSRDICNPCNNTTPTTTTTNP